MNQTPEELSNKIQSAIVRQQKEDNQAKGKSASGQAEASAARTALRAATDLVAALFVGGALGYWLDGLLGTRPLMMVVFLFVGFAAGFMNIYRSQTGHGVKTDTNDKKE